MQAIIMRRVKRITDNHAARIGRIKLGHGQVVGARRRKDVLDVSILDRHASARALRDRRVIVTGQQIAIRIVQERKRQADPYVLEI